MAPRYNWEEHDKGNTGVYTDDESGDNVDYQTAMASQGLDESGEDCDWCKKAWNKLKSGTEKFVLSLSAGEVSRAERALEIYKNEGINAYLYQSIGDAHYDEMVSASTGTYGTTRNAVTKTTTKAVTNFTINDLGSFRGAKSADVIKWLEQNGWKGVKTNPQ